MQRHGVSLGKIILNIPGVHNAVNALAVIALGSEIGVPFEKMAAALATFRGAKRRFEVIYESEKNLIVDDYGHHPTEIAATLATARTGSYKRIIAIFQPHRYTRTQALREEFGRAFDLADHVFVADIYPASEKPIPSVSGQTIVDEMIAHGHPSASHVSDLNKIHQVAASVLEEGDLIITLGAGNIHEASKRLAKDLQTKSRLRRSCARVRFACMNLCRSTPRCESAAPRNTG